MYFSLFSCHLERASDIGKNTGLASLNHLHRINGDGCPQRYKREYTTRTLHCNPKTPTWIVIATCVLRNYDCALKNNAIFRIISNSRNKFTDMNVNGIHVSTFSHRLIRLVMRNRTRTFANADFGGKVLLRLLENMAESWLPISTPYKLHHGIRLGKYREIFTLPSTSGFAKVWPAVTNDRSMDVIRLQLNLLVKWLYRPPVSTATVASHTR